MFPYESLLGFTGEWVVRARQAAENGLFWLRLIMGLCTVRYYDTMVLAAYRSCVIVFVGIAKL